MSLYILDTDIVSLLQRKHPSVVRQLLAHATSDEIVLTVLSVEEQLSGWYTFIRNAKTVEKLAQGYKELAETVQNLAGLRILPFSESAIRRHGSLKAKKLGVRKMDLGIAAIALEEGGILITRNISDFARIPDLKYEDWSKEPI